MKPFNLSGIKMIRCLTALLLTMLLSSNHLFSQTDWLSERMYRKPVVIAGTGNEIADYQIRVELTAANFDFVKAQSNGGDIRFTSFTHENDTTLLPYWIQSWNYPVSAVIWVRVPQIPSGGNRIHLYYGVTRGPGFGLTPKVTTSNGEATFLFFDDFESGTIDAAKWTAVSGPAVSVISDNNSMVAAITGPGLPDGHNRYLQSTGSFSDFILEMDVNMTADAIDNCTPEVGFRVSDNNNRYITMLRGAGLSGGGGPDGDLFMSRIEGGVQTTPPSFPAYDYTANHYYAYRISAGGTAISAWLDNTQVGSTWNDAGSGITTGGISIANFGGTVSSPVYFDNIRVRKHVANEPVVTLIYNEDKSWDAGTNNLNWNMPIYWDPYGVPAAGDNVTIPSGSQAYITGSPFPVNVFTECANLTVEPGSTLTVRPSGDLSVHGNLTINGTMQISSSDDKDGGSLIVDGTSTGIINFYRAFRTGAEYGDRHFFSSPLGGLTLSNFISNNSGKITHDGTAYQIWRYQETNDSWPLVTSGNLEAGTGYNLDLASDVGNNVILFRGTYTKMASVDVTSPYVAGYTARNNSYDYGLGNTNPIWTTGRSWVNYGGGGWNLLGNPFTSSMDAAVFISENAGKFDPWYEALYLYDGRTNQYKYAASTIPGWEDPVYELGGLFGGFVQACQGFWVLALHDEITFNFNSATMQKHALPGLVLLKSGGVAESWPGIKLSASSGGKERSTLVVYGENMTVGLDAGYDVGQLSGNPEVEIYTAMTVADNSVNFARQALPLSEAGELVVPVGVDTENGGEVTFSAVTVPHGDYRYWLEDRTAGSFTEISTKSYTVMLPPKTFGPGRFFIIASANTPAAIDKPVAEEPDLRIWLAFGQVIIKGEVSNQAICEMFVIQGSKLFSRRLDGGEQNTVDLPAGVKGVIMVRVTDGDRVVTRKIVVP